jgi:hypothetical protein
MSLPYPATRDTSVIPATVPTERRTRALSAAGSVD